MIDWDDNAKAAVKNYDEWLDEPDNSLSDRPLEEFMNARCPTQTKTVVDSSQTSCSEGEEWTHTIDGLKVRFLVDGPDEAGEVPVVGDDGYYRIFDADQLKPIKQKITKSEAWDKLQYMVGIMGYTYSCAVEEIYDTYEVIDD